MAKRRSGNPALAALMSDPAKVERMSAPAPAPVDAVQLERDRWESLRDLNVAVRQRDQAQERVDRHARAARAAGASWAQIGSWVGLTGEGARRKYGNG